MPKCEHCVRKNHLLFECKFCNYHYCSKCVQYEIHECDNITIVKDVYSKQNEQCLYNNSCKKRKLEKI